MSVWREDGQRADHGTRPRLSVFRTGAKEQVFGRVHFSLIHFRPGASLAAPDTGLDIRVKSIEALGEDH